MLILLSIGNTVICCLPPALWRDLVYDNWRLVDNRWAGVVKPTRNSEISSSKKLVIPHPDVCQKFEEFAKYSQWECIRNFIRTVIYSRINTIGCKGNGSVPCIFLRKMTVVYMKNKRRLATCLFGMLAGGSEPHCVTL